MKDVKQFMETITGKIVVIVAILVIGLFVGSKFSNKKEPIAQIPIQDEVPIVESTSTSTEPVVVADTATTQKVSTPQAKTVVAQKPTIVEEQAPVQTPTKKPLRIDGLASIRIGAGLMENWDSDVENDGPVLDIVYLDNQGNIISDYTNNKVPITADVKLYAGSDPLSKKTKLVYSQHFDSSQIVVNDSYPKLRVLKEKINVNPDTDYQYGKSEVTIHTPDQGDFSATGILVTLYE